MRIAAQSELQRNRNCGAMGIAARAETKQATEQIPVACSLWSKVAYV
jgi:hypothetical protein